VSTRLSIDLDSLTSKKVNDLFSFLLAYVETRDNPDQDELELAPAKAPDPSAAFGKVSESGPTLMVGVESTPAAPPPPPPAASDEKDSAGLPWDGRIHASSRAKNKDGSWRLKRDVEKAVVEKVNTELRALMAIPSPGPQLVQTPAPPPPTPSGASYAIPTPAPPPPAPANAEAMRDMFLGLFQRVSAAMSEEKITEDQLNLCLTSLGVPSLPLLGARLDLVPQACALIDGVIAGQSA
jgi:hypothetical protein